MDCLIDEWQTPFGLNGLIIIAFVVTYTFMANRGGPDEILHGSYRQVPLKFKDFSRTFKKLSYCFQGLKTYEKY